MIEIDFEVDDEDGVEIEEEDNKEVDDNDGTVEDGGSEEVDLEKRDERSC